MVVQGTLTPLVVVQFHQPVPSVEAAYGVLPPTDLARVAGRALRDSVTFRYTRYAETSFKMKLKRRVPLVR